MRSPPFMSAKTQGRWNNPWYLCEKSYWLTFWQSIIHPPLYASQLFPFLIFLWMQLSPVKMRFKGISPVFYHRHPLYSYFTHCHKRQPQVGDRPLKKQSSSNYVPHWTARIDRKCTCRCNENAIHPGPYLSHYILKDNVWRCRVHFHSDHACLAFLF